MKIGVSWVEQSKIGLLIEGAVGGSISPAQSWWWRWWWLCGDDDDDVNIDKDCEAEAIKRGWEGARVALAFEASSGLLQQQHHHHHPHCHCHHHGRHNHRCCHSSLLSSSTTQFTSSTWPSKSSSCSLSSASSSCPSSIFHLHRKLSTILIIRGILIEQRLKFPIVHVPTLFPLLHWFQKTFCFFSVAQLLSLVKDFFENRYFTM